MTSVGQSSSKPSFGSKTWCEVTTSIVGIFREHLLPSAHLFAIVHARDLAGLFSGFGQRGQQHSGQNRDDGNDNEKFNEGEANSPGGALWWLRAEGGSQTDRAFMIHRSLSIQNLSG